MPRVAVKSPEILELLQKLQIDPDDPKWSEKAATALKSGKSTVQGFLSKGIPGWVREQHGLTSPGVRLGKPVGQDRPFMSGGLESRVANLEYCVARLNKAVFGSKNAVDV